MRQRIMYAILCLPLTVLAQAATGAELQDRITDLENRVGRLEGAPAPTSLSAFNPAIGLALDMTYHHEADKANVDFRSAEMNIEAPIDPFLKGWAIINGNSEGIEVEEAAVQTTALPYNLTVTAGRLFATFGRWGHFHDHELSVIDRPSSIEEYIGGESQGDGAEVSVLLPTPFYLNAIVGAYNKIGGENERAENGTYRSMAEFTYLGRLNTYADVGDNHSVELGASLAWTPRRTVTENIDVTGSPVATVTRDHTYRTLSGIDLTYRYQPSQGGLYKGVVWGTEVLQNDELRFDPDTLLPTKRVRAWAGYSYLWVKLGRHWRPGFLVDVKEDLDNSHQVTRTITPALTFDVTEFQRLRATYSRRMDNVPGSSAENIVALQWTAVMGHHVHGFRDQ